MKTTLAAALAAALFLIACQTTKQPANLAECEAILKGELSAEVIRARYGDPDMRNSLQCAAEEGDTTARQLLGEALILGHDPKGSFYQGLFWLALAERDGDIAFRWDVEKKYRIFSNALTAPDRRQLAEDLAAWDKARRLPAATYSDRLVTIMVNDRFDKMRALINEADRAGYRQIGLLEGFVLYSDNPNGAEADHFLRQIRDIASDENDAVAQFLYALFQIGERKASDKDLEDAKSFLITSLKSFDPKKQVSDEAYRQLTDGMIADDKAALSRFLEQETLSTDFRSFVRGLERCFKAEQSSECRGKGIDELRSSAQGGNGLAAVMLLVIKSLSGRIGDLSDTDALRAVRALTDGRTKGGVIGENS